MICVLTSANGLTLRLVTTCTRAGPRRLEAELLGYRHSPAIPGGTELLSAICAMLTLRHDVLVGHG